FDKKGRGVVNMQEVLNQSLNTGAVFVEQKLGKEKFNNYMMSFGVGEKTGIDLPNETKGLVDNFKKGDMEYANMSFGQGIALTPIEAARAFSVLANGGNLIKPHLVDEIKYNEGGSKKISYNDSISVIQPKTSEEISKMLVTVFDNYLGGNAKIAGYSIAAKTGTAQVSKEDGGGYYTDRHLHSFFGYFPAYDPQFLILLYTNNPKGVNFASQTLINPFIDITKFLISYYEVAPDR
ncbi:MAG: penicillin-binding transpeptidase domain-containing protein, partial [Candidatus Paceibacterota bacterium]